MTHVDSTKLIWGSMCIYIHDSMAFFPTKKKMSKSIMYPYVWWDFTNLYIIVLSFFGGFGKKSPPFSGSPKKVISSLTKAWFLERCCGMGLMGLMMDLWDNKPSGKLT